MNDRSLRIVDLVITATQTLDAVELDSTRLDADVLLMHLLGVERAGLYLAYPEPASDDLVQRYDELIGRRSQGEPVAYITSHREFMGLEFAVDPRVLIPRPETEWLVEWAIARVRSRPDIRRIVDVGTGSGAIAVAVAHRLGVESDVLVTGSDRSVDALAVARSNAGRHASGKVGLVAGDLLTWSTPGIDLILANLPYLRPDQRHPGIAREPDIALYAGNDGFELYRRLLPQAATRLTQGGALAAEIDPDQREIALNEARRWFPSAAIRIERDLAGFDRYLIVESSADSPLGR